MQEPNEGRRRRAVIAGSEVLLDRLGATHIMERDFAEPLLAFEQLLDEAIRLLRRALESVESPMDTPDLRVLCLLFRQTLTMLDGFHVLVSAGAIPASQMPLRSAFEASIYLDWILRDKDTRALQHYVAEMRQRLRSLESLEAGTSRNADFIADIKGQDPDLVNQLLDQAFQDKVRSARANLEANLKEPRLAPINQSFETLAKDGQDPPWYRPKKGPKDLRSLAQKVGMLAEYDRLYGGMSQVTHASTSIGNYRIPKRGEMLVEPLRHIEGLDGHFAVATSVLLHAVRIVTLEYRGDEMEGFGRRYMERYRDHLRMPKIETTWLPVG